MQIELMDAVLARPVDRPGWIYELKYDGYRILAGKEGAAVRLRTKPGTDATTWYPGIVAALARSLPGSWVIDAEICVLDERGIPDFEAMRNARGRRQDLALFVFDVLWLRGKDLRALPLLERKQRLRKLVEGRHRSVGYVSYIEGAGPAFYAEAVKLGIEGVVAKRADSPYVGGKSPLWEKWKPAGHHEGWERPRRRAKG
ncbi:MAG TPA: hypothetical protein VFA75_17975 [Nevskia sp.]|nr:hypothetical protein [Nevskia sp.]